MRVRRLAYVLSFSLRQGGLTGLLSGLTSPDMIHLGSPEVPESFYDGSERNLISYSHRIAISENPTQCVKNKLLRGLQIFLPPSIHVVG